MQTLDRLRQRRPLPRGPWLLLPGLLTAVVAVTASSPAFAAAEPGTSTGDAVTKGDSTGTISGTVKATGGAPVAATIEVRTSGGALAATTTSSALDGTYMVTVTAPASYRVRALVADSYLVDEAWDDLPCLLDCSVTTGDLVATTAGGTTSSIDFVLAEGGRFSGSVTEATTGAPVGWGAVLVYDQAGDLLGNLVLADGLYMTEALPASADYFAIADTSFSPELYSELPCPDLLCVPTTGTPIPMVASTTVTGIDFTVELTTFGGITGTVLDASTGGPLAEQSFVDVFDAFGSYVDSAAVTGAFAIGDLLPGTYYLSTDTSENNVTYIDELYDDLTCHPGGAFNFACNPLAGSPVVVTGGVLSGGIVIELVREQLFADGFESGDLSAWLP